MVTQCCASTSRHKRRRMARFDVAVRDGHRAPPRIRPVPAHASARRRCAPLRRADAWRVRSAAAGARCLSDCRSGKPDRPPGNPRRDRDSMSPPRSAPFLRADPARPARAVPPTANRDAAPAFRGACGHTDGERAMPQLGLRARVGEHDAGVRLEQSRRARTCSCDRPRCPAHGKRVFSARHQRFQREAARRRRRRRWRCRAASAAARRALLRDCRASPTIPSADAAARACADAPGTTATARRACCRSVRAIRRR